MTDQISKTIRQKKVIFYKSWSRAELKTSLELRVLSASTCVIPSTLPVGRLLADYRGIYLIRSSYWARISQEHCSQYLQQTRNQTINPVSSRVYLKYWFRKSMLDQRSEV